MAEASDLYVLGSDSEGTPVSLIERGAAARAAARRRALERHSAARMVAATARLYRELVAARDPTRRA